MLVDLGAGSRRRAPICWSPRRLGTAQHLVKFALVEAYQSRHAAASILAEDLDQTGNKELLLLVGLGLPVVWLPQGDDEAHIAGPLTEVGAGGRAGEGLDVGEVVEEPCLADGKGAIGVLLGLV